MHQPRRPKDRRCTANLEVCTAAVDDESGQDSEKHNCGGDRPPVIFAPPGGQAIGCSDRQSRFGFQSVGPLFALMSSRKLNVLCLLKQTPASR